MIPYWIIIVLLAIWITAVFWGKENFHIKPTKQQRDQLIRDMMANKHLFDPATGSFKTAKSYLPTIDNVMYTRAQTLHSKNMFTAAQLDRVLF